MVKAACAGNLFAKASGGRATAAADLAERVEGLLTRRCLDLIGLARRAGQAATGFEKARAWLRAGKAGVLLAAADGADGGRAKLRALASGVAVLEALPGGSEQLAGVFTERDLMMRVVARGLEPAATPLANVMTPNPVVVDTSDSVQTCLRTMKQAKCRHLPVVSAGRLVGMVSLRDLLQLEVADRSEEADLMRSYIHSVPPGTELP